jgi:hypothetical protein
MNQQFATSEGLRSVLTRIHDHGPEAWRTDPDAEGLMRFVIDRYRPLAASHHCSPEDAALPAFEAMRTDAVRRAKDPWAVVTRAVQLSLMAEQIGGDLLCSPSRSWRSSMRGWPRVARFCDTMIDGIEVPPGSPLYGPLRAATKRTAVDAPTEALEACDMAVALFVALGWPHGVIRTAVEMVADRLIACGSRPTAHAYLRRDRSALAVLDIDRKCWASLLRLLLGNPSEDARHTTAGRGLLLRFLIGEPLVACLDDELLVAEISAAAPHPLDVSHA